MAVVSLLILSFPCSARAQDAVSSSLPSPIPSTLSSALSPLVTSFTLAKGIALEMVWIPAGVFQMGDSAFGPVHRVELDGFWMGKYEITQAQYECITGKNPSRFKGANHPVEQLNWTSATDFCQKLKSKTGKTFQLPTEAQWEYACRAGGRTRFAHADSESGLGDYAWYSGNAENKTHPVGGKLPNAFGLHDMIGNVYEWCSDWYEDKYYSKSPGRNPPGPRVGECRVLRGGAWSVDPSYCPPAYRSATPPTFSRFHMGFRVVWIPSEK